MRGGWRSTARVGKGEILNFEHIIFKVLPSHLSVYNCPSLSLSSISLSISVFISNSVTFLLGCVDLEVIRIDMLIRARADNLFQAESPIKKNQVNKCCMFTAKFGELDIISC